jgi:hypothetical protein
MDVAETACVRRLLPLVYLFALPAAAQPSILSVEPRVGKGVALGGGSGEGHARLSPLTLGILVDYAFNADPWISFYAGPFAEVADRGSIGGMAGFRFRPGAGRPRLAAGGTAILVPYTLYGVTASVGTVIDLFSLPISIDIEGVAFFAGTDLPEATVAGQLRLVLGIPIEVF